MMKLPLPIVNWILGLNFLVFSVNVGLRLFCRPSLKSALRPPPGRKVLISAHFT